MDHSFKLEYILDLIGANYTIKGNYSGEITGIASLAEAREGDLSFIIIKNIWRHLKNHPLQCI